MKQLLTPDQKKRMWRNAAIRKEFTLLNDGKNAKTACYKYLAEKHNLTEMQIRNIIAKKGANNG